MGIYHRPFLDAAGILPGDRVLDVGCGTGQTTRDVARAARGGNALGVDLSSQMIDLARRLAVEEGVGNVRFEVADAQVCPFGTEGFDVVISRTAAMFFGDPLAAFRNIAGGLLRDGRMSLLVWQGPEPNEWLREFVGALAGGRDVPTPGPDVPGPFALADPARVSTVLEAAGFADISLQGLSGPMHFGPDAESAFGFVLGLTGWMLEGLDEEDRDRAKRALRSTIAAHANPDGVTYDSATWLITARRA